MKLLLTLLLLHMMITIVYCVCGRPNVYTDIRTFGTECRYRCNCLNNEQCNNSTGECPSGCLPGWMGPACQYRNLAAAAKPKSSLQYPYNADFPPSNAIDGNISTCTRTGFGSGQRYLTIDLGSPVYIVGLVLQIQASDVGNFRGFTAEVRNNTSEVRLCYAQEHGDINLVTEINCFQPMIGQQIRIKLAEGVNGSLAVCEIGIYGGRIVSFNQKTSMDSVYDRQTVTGPFHGAYAVDGQVHYSGLEINAAETITCASTDVDYDHGRRRWWSVDLLHSYSIQAVSFFARQDNNDLLSQYTGYVITVRLNDSNFLVRDPKSNRQTDYAPKSHNLTWPAEGRFVNVTRDNVAILTICELEVFAECAYGLCGWDCNEICMCRNQTAGTHKILGTCPNGCAGRWTGINRKCNIECADNRWGTICDKECENCELPCNVVNGTCQGHCLAGWELPYCTQGCAAGKYGTDCLMDCGNCKENKTCDRFNGHCSSGCKPGYKPPDCHDACIGGRYGDSCSEMCGSCLDNATCNRADGRCPTGCQAGYEGSECKTKCTPGTYGNNCKEQCGKCANITDCHIETGLCFNNQCLSGWRGEFCTENIERYFGDSDSDGVPVLVGIVCTVVVVAVVVAVIVYLKRRSSSAPTKYIHQNEPTESLRTTSAFEPTNNEHAVRKSDGFKNHEDEYYNIGDPGYEVPNIKFIDTVNLRAECRKAKKDPSIIYTEFQAMPFGPLKDASEASRTEYIKKNRYRDLYPYNENRVHLPQIPGDSISTYINASYIDGYDKTKKYIAAQGALNTTVDDIWRMIWSENITVIAMLTDCFEEGKLKCVKYWPDEGSMQYGHIRADLVSKEEYTDFTIRRFFISKDDDKGNRKVVQYHYKAWPDKDVPDTALSIVQFWRKVREHDSGTNNSQLSPWLVHCSAGIGRTGTFIATDILFDQGKEEGRVDVKNCVLNLRYQRLKMVQTKEQYFLLHEILAEILDPIGTVYNNDEFSGIYPTLVSNSATNKQKLYYEYQEICKFTEEMAEAHEEGGIYFNAFSKQQRDGEKLENIRKSRESTIIPEDRDRPRLSSAVDGCNDFINAVYIPTYRYKDRMILTQYPLTETVVDFIRMIWQYDITEVVLLENPALENGMYWSKPKSYQVVGPFKTETLQETSQDAYVLRTLRVSMQGSKQRKDVRQYHFQKWTNDNAVPDNTSSILQLISDVENRRGNGVGVPVVIQCLDGAKRCGVFSIIYSVLERMKLDRQVAIAETLRLARVKRIQIIENFEQYKYCHDVINEYLRSFDVYANVT